MVRTIGVIPIVIAMTTGSIGMMMLEMMTMKEFQYERLVACLWSVSMGRVEV
jgi:hypothetical protein